jgi:very-short-patch-repair endonuclease
MRRHETAAERMLWQALRHRGLAGLKFRRQHPIDRYILDFYCHERQLAVELDGFHHFNPERRAYDSVRTLYLEGAGIRVIRFTNAQITSDLLGALQHILLLSPLPRGEGQG